jgi:ketosteroid isomerase-like protein
VAVSEANVEVVRRTLEGWQREDFDGWMSGCDPSIEWHTVLERMFEGPESVYRGHDGMRRLWHFYRTELENFEIEAQEIRDAGDDRVVLLGLFRWRGTASGIESESPLGMVITVRDGRIIQSVDYLSHKEALEAVGLSG